MKLKKIKYIIAILLIFLPLSTQAFSIKHYSNMPVEGDFVLGPGKAELFLEPGEAQARELKITNRTGKTLNIKIEIEDFAGSENIPTQLLGDEKGPYSLKDFIYPEKDEFILAHGEKATLHIYIKIPEDAEPGGLYGAAIVRAEPINKNNSDSKGQIAIISRAATLFFVKVNGEIYEEGFLKSFSSNKKIYQKSPVEFSIIFENLGNVHLAPYAEIKIQNILDKTIDKIDISPWFVMPGFSRNRLIKWEKGATFGRYTAILNFNNGYNDTIEKITTNFWIIPIKAMATIFSIILALSIIIKWFFSKFKFELKRK